MHNQYNHHNNHTFGFFKNSLCETEYWRVGSNLLEGSVGGWTTEDRAGENKGLKMYQSHSEERGVKIFCNFLFLHYIFLQHY